MNGEQIPSLIQIFSSYLMQVYRFVAFFVLFGGSFRAHPPAAFLSPSQLFSHSFQADSAKNCQLVHSLSTADIHQRPDSTSLLPDTPGATKVGNETNFIGVQIPAGLPTSSVRSALGLYSSLSSLLLQTSQCCH